MIEKPKFIEENYHYYDEEGIHIKEDAPDWAKEEYEEYIKMVNPVEDEDGIVTQY